VAREAQPGEAELLVLFEERVNSSKLPLQLPSQTDQRAITTKVFQRSGGLKIFDMLQCPLQVRAALHDGLRRGGIQDAGHLMNAVTRPK